MSDSTVTKGTAKNATQRLRDFRLRKKKELLEDGSETHNIKDIAQCRTCIEVSEITKFHKLTKQLDPTKTLADFLGDITQINMKNENEINLPQKICENCFQALINAYSFVMQAQHVNDYFVTKLYDRCEESQGENQLESNPSDSLSEVSVDIPTTAIQMKVEIGRETIYEFPSDISANGMQIKKEVVEKNICEMPVDILPNNIQMKSEPVEENVPQIMVPLHNSDVQIQTKLVEEIVNQMQVDISPSAIQLKIEVAEENVSDYNNKSSMYNENNFIRERRSTIGDAKEDMNEYESDLEKMSREITNVQDFHLEQDTEFEDKPFEDCATNNERLFEMTDCKGITSSSFRSSRSFSEDFVDSVVDGTYCPESPKGYDNNSQPGTAFPNTASSPLILSPFNKGRKRAKQPEKWKLNVIKKQRNSGKKYVSNSLSEKVREMKPPCAQTCRLNCYKNFSEDERKQLFSSYWELGDIEKKRQFIANCMQIITPTYRYVRIGGTRDPRQNNNAFFFKRGDNVVRVCKIFFINTLDISDRPIRTVVKKREVGGNQIMEPDQRGKHGKQKKLDPNLKAGVKQFIDKIPRIETRANTSKVFIEGSKTVASIYKDYVDMCQEKNEPFCTYISFYRTFNDDFQKKKSINLQQ